MEFKYVFTNEKEKEDLINKNSHLTLIKIAYHLDEKCYKYPSRNYSDIVEEDYRLKVDESQKKISILEAENEILKQELSITQDAINELIFNSLNM